MVSDTHAELVTYLQDTVDDYLRGIAVYTADEYDLVYLRDDLKTRRFKSEVDQMIDRLQQETRARSSERSRSATSLAPPAPSRKQ